MRKYRDVYVDMGRSPGPGLPHAWQGYSAEELLGKPANDTPIPIGSLAATMPPTDSPLLVCRDCGARFAFSEEERQAFASVGHSHPPSRCSACRGARTQRQVNSGARRIAPAFRELRQTQTTSIVCTSCGESALVPFAPRADRAVYCSNCYQRRRAAAEDA
jgi:CxxC-x17-CxxC domain-containing protein